MGTYKIDYLGKLQIFHYPHLLRDEFENESRIPREGEESPRRKGTQDHRQKGWDSWFGAGQAVSIDPATGAPYGGADPRRDGAAAGYSGGKAISGKSEKN